MNLQAVNGGGGESNPGKPLDGQLTFFLDYAERALQDFVRAINPEERLAPPKKKSTSGFAPDRLLHGMPALKSGYSPHRLMRT